MAIFQYLGRPLGKTDDDLPAVRRNIMRARLVWGRLGILLRQEGEDPRCAAIFNREVVQEVLIYGLYMWVLLESMEIIIEGIHTGLLRQIMGKRACWLGDGTWEMPGAELVWEAAGLSCQ